MLNVSSAAEESRIGTGAFTISARKRKHNDARGKAASDMMVRHRMGDTRTRTAVLGRALLLSVLLYPLALQTGCYAPLSSRGVSATLLPDSFRQPYRSMGSPLNLSSLTGPVEAEDVFGVGDLVEVRIPDLLGAANVESIQAKVGEQGSIYLPLVGPVPIAGLSVPEAHRALEKAVGEDVLRSPRVSILLVEKAVVDVVVLGSVKTPGTYALPRDQADAAHALAAAGGLAERGSYRVEIHRRFGRLPREGTSEGQFSSDACNVEYIDLRDCSCVGQVDATLADGDAIYVPNRNNDVFYVVGNLHPQARNRFTIGNDDRELGGGFLLPRDRDVDVVTAVAMAGYLDPIESPTTVTIHRRMANGESLLIKSDLIKARYDPRESVMIMPGDIVYLNPDPHWYFRRLFDRVFPDAVTISYRRLLGLNQ